jgi:hypothetical protein
MKHFINFLGVLLIFALNGTNLFAQILSNGTGGGDWNTATTWIGGVVPTVTDDVIVQTGDVVTLASQGECASLVLQANATLSLDASGLVVPGSAWTFDVTSTVVYNGTTTIQSGPVYGNLTYATTSNGGPNGDLTISGNLTITGSTVRGISDVTGTRTHTVAGDVLLSGTGSRITAVNSGSATDASCTWNIGGNVSLTAANSGNRIILYESGGPHSGSAVFNIDGNLSLTASSQIMLKSSSSTSSDFPEGIINLKGNLVQDGRIGINSAASGTSPGLTINFNGSSTQDWSNSGTGDFAISAFVVTLNVDNPAGVTISFAASMPDRTVLKSTGGDFSPLVSLTFADGSIYEHAQNAGAIPIATWDVGSTCLITGVVADRPTNTNQDFYNFTWNCPSQTGNEEVRWSGNTIGGDVTCVSSGGSQFRFTSSTEYTDSITILGNVNLLDGTLTSTGSSTAMSYLIIVHGDINVTGGTFRLTAASGATVNWRLIGDLNVTNAELRSSGTTSKFIFDGDALIDTQRVAFTGATYNGTWDYEIGSTAIVRIVDGLDSIDVQVGGNFINGGDIVADGWVQFLDGSNYQHTVNSGTVPNGIWDTGSTATFTGITTQAPANRNQSYYNIVWNCPDQVSNLNMGFDEVTIGGDINIISTGASNRWYLCGPVGGDSVAVTINGNIIQTGGQFSSQGTGNGLTMVEVTVLGNITVTGGNFACTRGSQGGTGTTNWYLYGENFSISDATTQNSNTVDAKFLFSGTTQQNLSLTNVTFSSGFPVEVAPNAILDVGISQIYSSGIFTVNDGATLQTANDGGLDSLLQTTGVKTLSTAGNYTFNGTAAQYTGSLLPLTINNLTVDNSSGVTLSGDVTVNGTLAVNNGDLHLDGRTVTLGTSATLVETPGNTVTDVMGKVVTTRDLNAPSGLNVGGMGAMLTTTADLGSTTIERYHYAATEGSNDGIFRVFNIVPTNNTTLNASLRYYYDESELNGAGESGLELYKSPDGNNNTWVLQGGIVNTTDNYVELSAIGSFSYWTLFGEATNTFQ